MVLKEGEARHKIETSVLKKRAGRRLQHRVPDSKAFIVPEDPEKSEYVLQQPRLFPRDHRIRHNPEGEVFIVSYRGKAKKKEEQQPGKVSLIRWSRYSDIETAIRGAEHVRKKYDIPNNGEAIGNIRNVIDLVKDLSLELQQRGVTDIGMGLMSTKAGEVLLQNGYDTAVKPGKIKIFEQIMSATNLDSLDRVNPSRSRLILSHVWIDLIQELLVGRRVEEKYKTVREKLIRSREFQRFLLSQAAAYIDESVSQRTGHHEEERTTGELKTFAREYLSSHFINTMPYSQVAAVSRFLIVHKGTPEEVITLSKYIGEDAQMFEGTPRLSQLDGRERKRRLSQISILIKRVLKEGEEALTPKKEEVTQPV